MSRRPPQVVSTVDLPSGKTLEVVKPEQGRPYTRLRPVVSDDRDLCVCEVCASELVEPVEWAAAGPERWRVALLCPNCEYWTEGVFSQECVDRFDERLDEGTTVIVEDLKRLEQANFAEDVEQFVGALMADAILPEDF
ncbi:MAG: hypothetical protein ACRDJY_11185 [Thermoleophilaceae bacterium]